MAIRNLRLARLVCLLALVLVNPGCTVLRQNSDIIRPSKSLPSTSPWDLKALSNCPHYEWSEQDSPVWSLYYEGEDYKGHPTRVFAYYASPATLNTTIAKDHTFPAVVLVHGGGGKAFKEWAELWAKRGYAAIAMDLTGCGPDGKRLADGGPGEGDKEKFGAIDQPQEDQWTYHGVANVILAHSLIRCFKEVDSNRTAVTGISWGGYLTCIVAGLDNRFKAAVPVYGCGFLYENSTWLGRFKKMTPPQKDKWVRLWDPSMYIGSTAVPTFFINGTNDFAYPLDSYSKTYGCVKSKRNFRITVNMPHGHPDGWAPEEIGLFVDQYLKCGVPLPTVTRPYLSNDKVCANVKSQSHLASATLYYTTGTTPINKLNWENIPAGIEADLVTTSAPPEEATIWFLTVTDDRGAVVSSELVFSSG